MEFSLTKKAILAAYARALTVDTFKDNRLLLVTAAGIISGIPVLDEEKSNVNIVTLQSLNSSVVETFSEQGSSEVDFILLKDARFEAAARSVSFPVLTVFCDQIIAASIAHC